VTRPRSSTARSRSCWTGSHGRSWRQRIAHALPARRHTRAPGTCPPPCGARCGHAMAAAAPSLALRVAAGRRVSTSCTASSRTPLAEPRPLRAWHFAAGAQRVRSAARVQPSRVCSLACLSSRGQHDWTLTQSAPNGARGSARHRLGTATHLAVLTGWNPQSRVKFWIGQDSRPPKAGKADTQQRRVAALR
jgi:hypothetical protein